MIIDSHCHLDYEPLNSNIKSVIKRAEDVGVKYFLTICTTDVSFLKILKILKENKNVFGTMVFILTRHQILSIYLLKIL